MSLTTHVLDIAGGRPAAGVAITLMRDGEVLATAVTNADGRTDAPLLDTLEAGFYELRFAVGDYFGGAGFLDVVPVRFGVVDPASHHHVPLLVAPGRLQHLPWQLSSPREVVGRCRELARVSDEEGRTTRWFGSPAMARANALVGPLDGARRGWPTRVDAAGNLVGSLPGTDPEAGTLLLGSHLDTVRDAGAFDGPLGVLAAIACVARLRARGRRAAVRRRRATASPTRRGCASAPPTSAAARSRGRSTTSCWRLADADGVAPARRAHGVRRATRATRRGAAERLLGYLELHIEQGPVLERARRAGRGRRGDRRRDAARTCRSAAGAGHAGTVPMDARRDAACAVAEFVLAVEEAGRADAGARRHRRPARPRCPARRTSIPGAATASLDVRHADDAVRAAAVAALRERATGDRRRPATSTPRWDAAARHAGRGDGRARWSSGWPPRSRPSACRPLRLPSGAGHDAVALRALTGTAMLFVRCAGGVSHHPDESVDDRRRRGRARGARPLPARAGGLTPRGTRSTPLCGATAVPRRPRHTIATAPIAYTPSARAATPGHSQRSNARPGHVAAERAGDVVGAEVERAREPAILLGRAGDAELRRRSRRRSSPSVISASPAITSGSDVDERERDARRPRSPGRRARRRASRAGRRSARPAARGAHHPDAGTRAR